jgi:hypothetical protein
MFLCFGFNLSVFWLAAQCQAKKELAAVAVTLNDVQRETLLYTSKWPIGPQHNMYLNIYDKGKRKQQPKLHVDG